MTIGSNEKIERFSRKNWITVTAGIALVLLGFLVLYFANAEADNLPAFAAPPLIISGYIIIGIGILL